MKTHSTNYKNGISKLGRQLKSKITYTNNGATIELSNDKLNSINPGYETSLLKSVMKYIEIDSNEEIPLGTVFKYELGLKTDSYIETTDTTFQANKDYYTYSSNKYVLLVAGTDYTIGNTISGIVYEFQEYEYLDFGNYVVKEVENKEDTNSYLIKAYDKMLYAMKDYEALGVTYPITIRNYIIALATKLGLTFANSTDTFCNYDREIQKELFLDDNGNSLDYTYRDVLDQLSEVVGGNLCIDKNDKLEIRYVNTTNDTINESYLKNINVKFGKTFGPVNSIVISRASESDNVFIQDDESVAENGLCEIKIKENQFMNFNDRDDYLEDLLDQLDGLEFSICDFDSTGVCYYELGDLYNVSVGNETYNCLMLNDTIEITQGLSESIYIDEPEATNTDYTKADKTDRKVNQTYIIADKQAGQITSLTSRVTTTEDSLRNTYTIEQVNTLIQTAESGITNTFSEAGGNNIFRNTGLFFENNNSDSATNPYEFWNGKVVRGSEDKASNQNCLLLQNDILYQEQTVPNGTYTISFKYKKLIALSTVKVNINGNEYELTATTDTNFTQSIEVNSRHINVQFICDIDNACEVYDLMVNAGGVALAYSQNQNETTTDTVNISKGIEITSSETNTKFRADSDGVRIYNVNSSSTDPVTKFTDRGMETDQAVIETKAEIVKTLWQDVNNHTWITRL